jgi:hypothetical protein
MNLASFLNIEEETRELSLLIAAGLAEMTADQRAAMSERLEMMLRWLRPPAPLVAEGELSIEVAHRMMEPRTQTEEDQHGSTA